MARNEFTADLTDSKKFEVSVTQTGNIVSLIISTEYGKFEHILDRVDAEAIKEELSLMLSARKGAA